MSIGNRIRRFNDRYGNYHRGDEPCGAFTRPARRAWNRWNEIDERSELGLELPGVTGCVETLSERAKRGRGKFGGAARLLSKVNQFGGLGDPE